MSLTGNIDLVYLRRDMWVEITKKTVIFKKENKHSDRRTTRLPK